MHKLNCSMCKCIYIIDTLGYNISIYMQASCLVILLHPVRVLLLRLQWPAQRLREVAKHSCKEQWLIPLRLQVRIVSQDSHHTW